MIPHKSTIHRWEKIILISENHPRVVTKNLNIHPTFSFSSPFFFFFMYFWEPMLFMISDHNTGAIICLARWGKMLHMSWFDSLILTILTHISDSFAVLPHFNFISSFSFVSLALWWSCPYVFYSFQGIAGFLKNNSHGLCSAGQCVAGSLLLYWKGSVVFCHPGRRGNLVLVSK